MPDFLALLRTSRPHVFDGAMGTMLYSKGVFINRCFDELVLRDPDLVRDIHREYIDAGADLVETNSYGANRLKLEPFGFAALVPEINEAAAVLARDAAGDAVA
ncbi:MAG: homocysteine S-methyltransferase family protein, partial [Gemmatimonadales bacterium]